MFKETASIIWHAINIWGIYCCKISSLGVAAIE